ncbi:MAG TPA: TonB-dependent receptor, partial [Burkholderiaceae bacterium]
LAGGVTWTTAGWDMDASLTYGENKMKFTIENTLNRSIGPTSKTEFDAGGFSYDQLTFNLSGVKQFEMAGLAAPLNVAVGTEARREGYEVFAGEPDSYRYGGQRLANGTAAPPGAQVFPGFQPANAARNSRTAVGAFVDIEANVTTSLLLSAALRAEHFSDFGNNVSGKLAGRFDVTPGFAVRGSVQNGFRAPSLQQQYFTSTSTNFIDGIPYEITTFRPTDPAAVALGAKPLDAEESLNYSLGAVFRADKLSVTVDAYKIKIDNRIVLSENLTQTNVRNFLTQRGFVGIGGGRFFINGVDTTTEGVDVVASMPWNAGAAGRFDFTLAASTNKTRVTKVPTLASLAALSPTPPLFDRVNVLTFERGQPKNKLTASANWKLDKFGATLRATRYGEVLAPGTTAALDFVMKPKTLVDLEGRFALTDKISIAAGADNVFDQYPGALPAALNTTGNAPFSNFSPFGRSGRFIYARATYSFN